jgi:hypothetical protein
MAISVICPNGHLLKVKNEFAGKSGFCPHCHGRVFVPMPLHPSEKARISDDEILDLLGEPARVKAEAPPVAVEPEPESVHDTPPQPGSGIDLPGSSILGKHKVCPNCSHVVSVAFTHCPRCATRLPTVSREKKPPLPRK